MNEEFKTIPGFEDYQISNLGRIISKERKLRYTHAVTGEEHFRISEKKFLKVYYNNRTGYKHVILRCKKRPTTKTIHRLVAITWIDNPNNLGYVNHIDGNKHNNIATNLEWCTNEYNHEHATITGLKAKGDKIGKSKLNDRCILAIRRLASKNVSHRDLSEAFGVSRPTINLVVNLKSWKHLKAQN